MSETRSPYYFVHGSDVQRDGYFVELTREEAGSQEILLEAFRSDVDGRVTFSAFVACELPFSVLEEFFHIALLELTSTDERADAP